MLWSEIHFVDTTGFAHQSLIFKQISIEKVTGMSTTTRILRDLPLYPDSHLGLKQEECCLRWLPCSISHYSFAGTEGRWRNYYLIFL